MYLPHIHFEAYPLDHGSYVVDTRVIKRYATGNYGHRRRMSCTYVEGAGRKDSAVYAITAKLLNPMVIWRITPRNNGQTPKASVWVCLTVRSREGAWRGMFRAHATANINITLSPSSPLSWRAIRVRRGIRGAYRGCAA